MSLPPLTYFILEMSLQVILPPTQSVTGWTCHLWAYTFRRVVAYFMSEEVGPVDVGSLTLLALK